MKSKIYRRFLVACYIKSKVADWNLYLKVQSAFYDCDIKI